MSKDSEHSSYREKLIEHLFIGELLKLSWLNHNCDLEVARPEVDNSGYDIVAEANRVIRHIQLKAAFVGSKTAKQNIHLKLANKPSGCVVWVYFNPDTLELGPFLFFGGKPGQPLPDIQDAEMAKHTKGNQDGVKNERPNIRKLNKGRFTAYKTAQEIYDILFGGSA